ncbi:unnamed protein product [Choristocarpus tenellus]
MCIPTIPYDCLPALSTAVSAQESVELNRWIGRGNVTVFRTNILFFLTVIEPLRRMMLDPLAESKRSYADRILLSTRTQGARVTGSG